MTDDFLKWAFGYDFLAEHYTWSKWHQVETQGAEWESTIYSRDCISWFFEGDIKLWFKRLVNKRHRVPVRAMSLQSCPTLQPHGSSIHGILQARILECVSMPFSKGSSWPRDRTSIFYVSCTGRWALYHLSSATWESVRQIMLAKNQETSLFTIAKVDMIR